MSLWKRPARLELPRSLEPGLGDLDYAIHPAAFRPGNHILTLCDGAETYASMLAAIGAAVKSVNLEVYILQSDAVGRRFGDALAERARAGVAIRLLYDAVGSISLDDRFVDELRASRWAPTGRSRRGARAGAWTDAITGRSSSSTAGSGSSAA